MLLFEYRQIRDVGAPR